MHARDVSAEQFHRSDRIVTVYVERPGDEIAGERPLGQSRDEPCEVGRCRPARLGAEHRSGALAPGADVGEHVDEQPPLGRRLVRRNLPDMIEHDARAEGMCQFERRLRGRDPALEPLGIAIAAAGAKRDGRHDDPFVAEPLANLAEAGLGELPGVKSTPGVDLDTADAEIVGPPQRAAQVAGERDGGDGESGGFHAERQWERVVGESHSLSREDPRSQR